MSHEWLTAAWTRVRALVERRKFDDALEEELQFHLTMREEKNLALGLPTDDARAAARRRFGNFTLLKESCREMRTFTSIETLWQDLRYASRSLAKSPGFALVLVFSIALGIAANVTIFSVINTVLWHALPYQHSERLTAIWATQQGQPDSQDPPPIAELVDWKKQNAPFDDIAAVGYNDMQTLSGMGEPQPVRTQKATPNFFDLLGVQPALGRIFRADEAQDQFQTVVLSNAFWKAKLNSNPNVLGQSFRIEGVDSTVVGVMPAGFFGFAPYYEGNLDVWIPIDPERERYSQRRDHAMMPVARLKPGVTLAQAQLEMDLIARQVEHVYPESNKGVGKKLLPLYDVLYEDADHQLYPLLGAVGFVLLICCVNVAILMLSRSEVRRKEYSLRVSLGAGRRRLMQQLLIESGLLSLIGASLGVLLSSWGTHIFRVLAAAYPNAESISIDTRVLLFALGLSVLMTILFGLVPALHASRPNLQAGLQEGESRTSTASRSRTRYLFVVAEVALSVVLLAGTGLMINSLLHLVYVSLGFDPANVLTMAVNFPEGGRYVEKIPRGDWETVAPQVSAFHQQLLKFVATLPGVESVGMTSMIPPTGGGSRTFSVLGHPVPSPESMPEAGYNEVSPNFFHTMKIPIEKGRGFDDHDTESSQWVVVINEKLAHMYFPNEDPIGQRLILHFQPDLVAEDRPRQIVGVVGDVKQVGLGAPHPLLYESFLQQPKVFPGGNSTFHLWGSLVIRTVSDVRAAEGDLTASVKSAVQEMDPEQPVTDIATMDQVLWKSLSGYRLYVLVLGVFAGTAVVLAAIGTYGVMSYFVNQRRRELGIRVALGAQRSDILTMVTTLGLRLAAIGIVVGIALAVGVTKLLLADRLYGVKPTDPWTYVAVSAVLISIAFLACYVPARRATKVDPMAALRHE